MKLKRYSSDVYQILGDEGSVEYLALRMANGKWGAFNKDDVRISRTLFASPKIVLEFCATRSATGGFNHRR